MEAVYDQRQAELDQWIAALREHLMSMGAEAAKVLSLYEHATQLAEGCGQVERDLAKSTATTPELLGVNVIRSRASAEFDRLGEVLAGGTVEERRELIACYVQKIKADPDRQTVHISLYPTLLSQKIAGTGFDLTQSLIIREKGFR